VILRIDQDQEESNSMAVDNSVDPVGWPAEEIGACKPDVLRSMVKTMAEADAIGGAATGSGPRSGSTAATATGPGTGTPAPAESLRRLAIELTSRSRWPAADRHGGRRNLWLRTMDALGLGFGN
jgi:hypothetical protein